MSYLFFFLFACKETIEPSGIWEVEITGIGSNDVACTESTEGFQESYQYALYYDGTFAEIKIKDSASTEFVSFATGEQRGYSIDYESPTYLEESTDGNFNWQIVGTAFNDMGTEGSDNIPAELDWKGTETLTVTNSINPNVPEGCTYEMEVEGVYIP